MPEKQTQPTTSRTLVITRTTFFDIDKIVAAIVLGKLLSRKYQNQVDLYFGEKVPVSTLTSIVAPQDINFREKLNPDYFTLSVYRGNANVKEVKWEEVGEELKLIIYTDQGQIDASHSTMAPGVPVYDYVYTLGIKSKEEALNALGEFSGLWQTAKTFNLDVRAENQRYAENNYIYADAKSFAESVFKFAREREIEVTNTEATELLSCIYWKTNSLRNKYTTFDTIGTVQQLIQNGGSVSEAVSRIFSTLSFVEIRARQEIYKTLKLTSEKIAFAQVTPETARQLSKIQPLNPEKNPLFKLKDAVSSFVLMPLTDKSTLVLCSSRDDKINLKKLFSSYNFVGDALQAELVFNMNVADTEREIKKNLQKVFPKPAAPTQPSEPQQLQPTSEAVADEVPTPTVTPVPQPPMLTELPKQQVPQVAEVSAPAPIAHIPAADTEAALASFVDSAVNEFTPQAEDIPFMEEPLPTEPVLQEPQSLTAIQTQPAPIMDAPVTARPIEAQPTTQEPAPLAPASEEDLVMVEVPPSMSDLGPADPLPSAA